MNKCDLLAEKIAEHLYENGIYGEVYSARDNEVCVEINWGDWKHDHLRTDWLVKGKFHPVDCFTEETETDGSDCYSGVHHYLFD